MSKLQTPLALSASYVLLSGALAFALYKLLSPRDSSDSATNVGRRWSAWVVALGTVPMFARVLHRSFDLDSIALWMLGAGAWGAVAFLAGCAWTKYSNENRIATQAGAPTLNRKVEQSGTNEGNVSMAARPDTPSVPQLVNDEGLWASAAQELDSANRRPGLWAKAFAAAQGDEALARVNYLTWRVQQLQSELPTSQQPSLELKTSGPLPSTQDVSEPPASLARTQDPLRPQPNTDSFFAWVGLAMIALALLVAWLSSRT